MKKEIDIKEHECPSIRCAIRLERGKHLTDVWKNGKIIKTHPTDYSQISQERKSCLWSADENKGKDYDIEEVERRTIEKNAYINSLNIKGKKGLHNRNATL